MLLLMILVVETALLIVAAFGLAAWAEGGVRLRDWSLRSTHPRPANRCRTQ